MIVIGLHGFKRTGKSTVAKRLVERWGFVEIAFADPIKRGLRAMFGLSEADFTVDRKEAPHDKLGGRSPRTAMQTLGTEWGRTVLGETIWVQAAERALHAKLELGHDRFVFSDVRYGCEARWLREALNGQCWLIQNPRVRPQGEHSSEQGVDLRYLDRGLLNDRGLDELWATVDEYAKPLAGSMAGGGERVSA